MDSTPAVISLLANKDSRVHYGVRALVERYDASNEETATPVESLVFILFILFLLSSLHLSYFLVCIIQARLWYKMSANK